MVFAHRLECDQTDDDGSSILVPSALVRLPLLVLTALANHAVAAATSTGFVSQSFVDTVSFSSSSSGGYSYDRPTSAMYYYGDSGNGGGDCFGRRGSFTRWEPSLPTIDEEPRMTMMINNNNNNNNPQQQLHHEMILATRLHHHHHIHHQLAMNQQLVDVHGNPIAGGSSTSGGNGGQPPRKPSSSPSLLQTLVTLAMWLPAILWGVSFLWFAMIEPTTRAVVSLGWGIQ